MEFGGRRRRVSMRMLPLLALHVAYEYRRAVWKPPVTAGLLLANTVVYLRPGALDHILPTIDRVFFNPHLILQPSTVKLVRMIHRLGLLLLLSILITKLFSWELHQFVPALLTLTPFSLFFSLYKHPLSMGNLSNLFWLQITISSKSFKITALRLIGAWTTLSWAFLISFDASAILPFTASQPSGIPSPHILLVMAFPYMRRYCTIKDGSAQDGL